MKNWIAGFVAGALLFLLVPAQAHHRYSYSSLDSRIDKLEGKTRGFNTYGELDPEYIQRHYLCRWDDPAVWDVSGLSC